jgi:hypothetical protein
MSLHNPDANEASTSSIVDGNKNVTDGKIKQYAKNELD